MNEYQIQRQDFVILEDALGFRPRFFIQSDDAITLVSADMRASRSVQSSFSIFPSVASIIGLLNAPRTTMCGLLEASR